MALGRLLYDLEIHGHEHLPTKGPLIIVGRHGTRLGLFTAAFFCSALKQVHGLAAPPAIVNNRVFAWLSRQLGMLPAFKEGGLSAPSLMGIYSLLSQGHIVFMGADGEPSWDGRFQPLRPGAAWLALRTSAPVVVLWVQGDYDIWPRWASRPHLTGKLVLKIGKPFYLCDAPCTRVTDQMLQEANQRLMAELERLADGYMIRSGASKAVEA